MTFLSFHKIIMQEKFVILIIVTFRLYFDWPVENKGGSQSIQLKLPLNPKSLATLSHVLARIQALAVVTDSKQSVTIPSATQPSGQTLSGEKQRAVSGNTLDHSAIRAGSQW